MITQSTTAIPRNNVVLSLAQLREEWEQAAESESLLQVNANVGLLLADVAMSLGLDTIEQVQVFGAELAYEIEDALARIPRDYRSK